MATLDQIAREAGVSRGTVANVLKGRTKEAWAGTAVRADEIRAIAERIGYRPNAAAVATATGRFNCFGLIASEGHEYTYFPSGLLWGINDAMESAGLHLSIGFLPDEAGRGETVPKLLRELMVDGLLVNGINESVTRRLLGESASSGKPRSMITVNWEGAGDCVFPDDEEAGRRATEHLLGLGHRNIAYAELSKAAPHHPSVSARRKGFQSAMKSAGLQTRVVEMNLAPMFGQPFYLQLQTNDATLLEQARAVLCGANRPTALVFYEADECARAFFSAALELGMRVPHQLSLVSIANTGDVALLTGLRLSLLEVPFFELGRRSVLALIEKTGAPQLVVPPCKVPYGDLLGNTTAHPAA